MKRMVWFGAGAAAGVSGSMYARRKMRQAAERYKPVNVAKGAVGRARGRGRDLVEAVKEGRAAMTAKEAELRARQDGSPPAALAPTVQVLVVEAAEVPALPRHLDGPRRRSRR